MSTVTILVYAVLVVAAGGFTWLSESTRRVRVEDGVIVVRSCFGSRFVPARRITRATVRTDALGGEVLIIGVEDRRISIVIPLGGAWFDDSTRDAVEILLGHAASRGADVDPDLFAS